jgi:hypothetical protein
MSERTDRHGTSGGKIRRIVRKAITLLVVLTMPVTAYALYRGQVNQALLAFFDGTLLPGSNSGGKVSVSGQDDVGRQLNDWLSEDGVPDSPTAP